MNTIYTHTHIHIHTYILEKGMATHSSILAWRIPWTEEPGGLQSMGSQRVGDNGVTNRQPCASRCSSIKWG